MGAAVVPNVARFQQLKDGGLAVEADDFEDGISFKESWGIERIDRFMRYYFPEPFEYQEEMHRELGDGERHWVPLWADRKKLAEYKKQDELNGKDLVKIMAGKGKSVDASTLYFGQFFSDTVLVTDAALSSPLPCSRQGLVNVGQQMECLRQRHRLYGQAG